MLRKRARRGSGCRYGAPLRNSPQLFELAGFLQFLKRVDSAVIGALDGCGIPAQCVEVVRVVAERGG